MVDVQKFRTLDAYQKGLDKQCRPRSDCFRSSVFPVCYSDKHFVHSSLANQYFIEYRKRKMFKILEHFEVS